MTSTITKTTAKMMYQLASTKFEAASSIRVGSGSFAWSDWKNVLNRGSTNTARTTTVTSDMPRTIDRVDQGRGDLAAGLGIPVDVVGELVEHDVEVAGQLGRREDAHVVRRERLGVRVGGDREGVAGPQGRRPSRPRPS